ncbi:MAG: hypothetical protein IH599_05300 [Bacteroidales bacterium]|nr:hypothetical protein [Bacteroidales bacterium]
MKKVFVILSLFAFLLAVNVNVSTAVAATADVEYAKIDKDPTKDGKKTDKAKASCTTSKDCTSSAAKSGCCSDKGSSATTKSGCSSAAKSSCGGEKKVETAQATPDKQ